MLDRPATTAQRLAGALITLSSGMDENHTAALLEMGFDGIDIVEHIEEAKRIANRRFVREVETFEPVYDRPARLARAKNHRHRFHPGRRRPHRRPAQRTLHHPRDRRFLARPHRHHGRKGQPARGDVVTACRVCGCTEESACIGLDGLPCHWASPGLCSCCGTGEWRGRRRPEANVVFLGEGKPLSARKWVPVEWMDEHVPQTAEDPASFLKFNDAGTLQLFPVEEGATFDDYIHLIRDVAIGEVVEFCWTGNHDTRVLTVNPDLTYAVDAPIPEAINCLYLPECEAFGGSLEDLMDHENQRLDPVPPGTWDLDIYTWSDGSKFLVKLVDGKPALEAVN